MLRTFENTTQLLFSD